MDNISAGKAILVEIAVAAAIGLILGLYALLNLNEMWVGFLFILWWSTALKLDKNELLNTALGGIVGIGLAYLMTNPAFTKGYGLAISGVLILVAVFFMIRGQLGSIINGSTMLYLTVGTIPAVLQSAGPVQYLQYIEIIVLTASLFWFVFWVVGKVTGKPKSPESLNSQLNQAG